MIAVKELTWKRCNKIESYNDYVNSPKMKLEYDHVNIPTKRH